MIHRRRPTAAGAALLLALSACSGDEDAPGNNVTSLDDIVPAAPANAPGMEGVDAEVVTVDVDGAFAVPGATPMAQRVAVLGLLNKRNGESRDITLRPGQAMRVGNDVIVRLRACERTAPWETDQYTGAFVQLDVHQPDDSWRRVFSGWLFKERPALNVIQHPIYDVWPKSCEMSFPEGGPDTVAASSVNSGGGGSSPARSNSSESNAPSTDPAPNASPPDESPSAESSSDT